MNMNPKRHELNIDILLEMEAPSQEVADVEEVARREGIRGSVRPSLIRLSQGELPWVVILLDPVAILFSAFLKGAGQEAGRDAYKRLKSLVSRLYNARRNRNGSVTVEDFETSTYIVLSDDLPEEAYRQLAELGLEQLKGGYWVWDYERNQWR